MTFPHEVGGGSNFASRDVEAHGAVHMAQEHDREDRNGLSRQARTVLIFISAFAFAFGAATFARAVAAVIG